VLTEGLAHVKLNQTSTGLGGTGANFFLILNFRAIVTQVNVSRWDRSPKGLHAFVVELGKKRLNLWIVNRVVVKTWQVIQPTKAARSVVCHGRGGERAVT
jgi:hypothetical protein